MVSRAGARMDASGRFTDPAVVDRVRPAVGELEEALGCAAHKRAPGVL